MSYLAEMRAADEVGQLLQALGLRARIGRALAWAGTLALPCVTVWAATAFLPLETTPWSHLLLAIPLVGAGAQLLGGRRLRLEAVADRRLGLADGLRTLALAPEADTGALPYLDCLRTDLNQRLRHRGRARALPPPRIRGARWWLFPLIFLLLLRFALPDFIGSAGPAGFGGGQGGSGGGAGGGGVAQGGGGAERGVSEGPREPAPAQLPPKPDQESQEQDEGQQPSVDPGPIPQPDKFKDVFVPPVAEVEGPRTEKEIAAVEAPAGGPPPPAPRREPRSGGDVPPPPSRAELERAVEEALARRRVDPAEARFVRRYFEIRGRESR